MKKNLLLLTFFILGLTLYSQPNLKWAFSISDSSALLLHEVIHDNSNNIYVLGGFYGDSIDIDPSNSKHIVTQTTAWGSMFLAKYSNAGNLLWGFSIDSCYATSMIINNGKIILLGNGNGDVDPSANIVTINRSFIAQYDLNGTFNWVQPVFNFSSPIPSVRLKSINTDINNNIFITGNFFEKISFNGVDTLQSWINGAGPDVFLAKYDSSGNNIWGVTIEKAGKWNFTCTDSSSNVYLIATHDAGLVDADPSNDTAFFNSARTKTIISKFNTNGVFIKANSFDFITTNAVSRHNGVVASGFIDVTVDFDPSMDTAMAQGSPVLPLLFIAVYDSNLNYTHHITPVYSHANDYYIDANKNGNYSLVGPNGKLDSTGIVPGNGAGVYGEYDQNNNLIRSFSYGDSLAPLTSNLLPNNDIVIGGYFDVTNNFSLDTTQTFNLTNPGNYGDLFIANYTYSSLPLTINDIDESNMDVRIFPNPTSNQLTIDTDLEVSEITIIDITGKTIKTITTELNSIHVADLHSGIYFLRLTTEERTITKKIIKE